FFFFQAEDGIRDFHVTGVQTCALPIYDPLYERVVALVYRAYDQAPHAGYREHLLDDHHARQEVSDLNPDHRDHRDHRVAHGVFIEDAALRRALGPGRAHEVAAQHLQQTGPEYARQARDHGQTDGYD